MRFAVNPSYTVGLGSSKLAEKCHHLDDCIPRQLKYPIRELGTRKSTPLRRFCIFGIFEPLEVTTVRNIAVGDVLKFVFNGKFNPSCIVVRQNER
jgi:hypothetical protein